jgi:hypothetical protein
VDSTRLEEHVVSPRLFGREDIHENLEHFKKGTRRRSASGLSGSVRMGTDVFFLIRWDDSEGRPWLETLVRVDLTQSKPTPQLLGRFQGLSLASGEIDERLFIYEGAVGVITRSDGQWGLATYTPSEELFSFRPLGKNLLDYIQLSGRLGVYVEQTSHDTRLVGRVFLPNGFRRNLLEGRGVVQLLDTADPLIAYVLDGNNRTLHNLETGAQIRIPLGAGHERTRYGVLVWSPAATPNQATLYDPERWTAITTWTPSR